VVYVVPLMYQNPGKEAIFDAFEEAANSPDCEAQVRVGAAQGSVAEPLIVEPFGIDRVVRSTTVINARKGLKEDRSIGVRGTKSPG
jgi:hypothetical protein